MLVKVDMRGQTASSGTLRCAVHPVTEWLAYPLTRLREIGILRSFERPADGCELNIAGPRARAMPMRTVLVSARGYGGFNGAVVLRRPP